MEVYFEHSSLQGSWRLEQGGVADFSQARGGPVASGEEGTHSDDNGGLGKSNSGLVDWNEGMREESGVGKSEDEEGGLKSEAGCNPNHAADLYCQDHFLGEGKAGISDETIKKLGERLPQCLKLYENGE